MLFTIAEALARADDAVALRLEDVLVSVRKHHPLLASERAGREVARAEARAARGEFDTVLTVQGRVAAAGYYDPRRLDAVLEQPLPVLGSSIYAGYRLTRGNVAPYYGELRTLDRGEVRGGVRLPLLQDLAIDARRAGISTAGMDATAAEQTYREVELALELDAAIYYYSWVAAGRKLLILERLVELARSRDEQIRTTVSARFGSAYRSTR